MAMMEVAMLGGMVGQEEARFMVYVVELHEHLNLVGYTRKLEVYWSFRDIEARQGLILEGEGS